MLHTIAALFPDDPSKQKQEAMVALLNSIAELYPCATCARHFRAYIREYPIPTPLTRKTISMWLCEAHNSVNVRLEKPSVSCANIEETWPNKLEQDCGCAATDSPTLDPKGPELDKKPTDASGATPTPASDAPSTAEAAAAAAKSARIAEEEERDRQQEKEREAKRKEQERRMEEDARLV
jgi:FAD-linked sulfhydryl oxidase